jgi:hypothetical protein
LRKKIIEIRSLFLLIQFKLYRTISDRTNTTVTYVKMGKLLLRPIVFMLNVIAFKNDLKKFVRSFMNIEPEFVSSSIRSLLKYLIKKKCTDTVSSALTKRYFLGQLCGWYRSAFQQFINSAITFFFKKAGQYSQHFIILLSYEWDRYVRAFFTDKPFWPSVM